MTDTTVGPAVTTLRTGAGPDCELVCDVVEGGGPPVVVLTGATGTRQISALLVQGLVGRRQLVLPDPRGHGEGVCRHPEHYSWRQLTDDVYGWLDELGITSCVLVGTSLGAVLAMAIAWSAPASSRRSRSRARPSSPSTCRPAPSRRSPSGD